MYYNASRNNWFSYNLLIIYPNGKRSEDSFRDSYSAYHAFHHTIDMMTKEYSSYIDCVVALVFRCSEKNPKDYEEQVMEEVTF